jgi:hypothetical protein
VGGFNYSADFVGEYGLKSQSHVQKAVRSLEERGLLHEGQFADPFFSLWIEREFGSS